MPTETPGPDRGDVTPDLDTSVAIGDAAALQFRAQGVFDSLTSGLVLTDERGLIFAADEGVSAASLLDEDLPGFKVRRGPKPIAFRETSCQPEEGNAIDFVLADDTVRVPPVSQFGPIPRC